jgi:hypothetical protein
MYAGIGFFIALYMPFFNIKKAKSMIKNPAFTNMAVLRGARSPRLKKITAPLVMDDKEFILERPLFVIIRTTLYLLFIYIYYIYFLSL